MLVQRQPLSQPTQLKFEENMTWEGSQKSTMIQESPIRIAEENNLEMIVKIQHQSNQKTSSHHKKQYDIKNTKASEGLKVALNPKQIQIISKLLQKYTQKKQSQKLQSESNSSLAQPSQKNIQIKTKYDILGRQSKDFFGSSGKRGKNVTFSQVIAVKKFRKDEYIEGLQFLPERYEGLNYLYKERQRQDLLFQRAQRQTNPQKKQKPTKKKNSSFLQLCKVVLQKGQKEKLLS